MVQNWKGLLGAILLALTMFASGAAFTATAHAQTMAPTRGELRSAANIVWVRRRLEGLIDQLQRDQRDYGGHRIAAIGAMQQARVQLDQAIDYDRAHPGR